MIARKIRFLIFLLKNSFSIYSLLKNLRKHSSYLVKLTELKNHMKHKKPNLKSFHYIKLFDIKIDYFGDWNYLQQQLSLST